MAKNFYIIKNPGLSFDPKIVDQRTISKTFGQIDDYVELHIYDNNNNLIQSEVPFLDYEMVPNEPHSLKVHPEKTLNDKGFLSGEYTIKLNFVRSKIFKIIEFSYCLL